MRAFIATDFRLYEKDGKLFLNDTTYVTVLRYKEIFGDIILCTRVIYDEEITEKMIEVTNVLSAYVPIVNLKEAFVGKSDKKIRKQLKNVDVVISRVPSIIAYRVTTIAYKLDIPILALAMGCAWGTYWNHSVKGKIIAPYMLKKMKKVMKQSDYALYVTSEFLQKRYPCRTPLNIGISDVKIEKLDKKVLEKRIEKINCMSLDYVTLMTIGDISNKIKGQKYVIRAISRLKKEGKKITYVLVGEGSQEYLRNIAKKYDVENQLLFKGRLTAKEVVACLDECDIYIQPSLQEGLPRSVVEAMSRGCPIIGTRTGGIPELVASDYLVDKKSDISIFGKLNMLISKENMREQAELNFKNAQKYDNEALSYRRNEFYKKVKQDLIRKTEKKYVRSV